MVSGSIRPSALLPGTVSLSHASSVLASNPSPSRTSLAASISLMRSLCLECFAGQPVFSQQPARNHRLVYLVCAIVDAGGPLVPEPVCQGQIIGHPEGAVGLNGAVDHPLQDARHVELDDGDVVASVRSAAGIDRAGGLAHHQARRLELGV